MWHSRSHPCNAAGPGAALFACTEAGKAARRWCPGESSPGAVLDAARSDGDSSKRGAGGGADEVPFPTLDEVEGDELKAAIAKTHVPAHATSSRSRWRLLDSPKKWPGSAESLVGQLTGFEQRAPGAAQIAALCRGAGLCRPFGECGVPNAMNWRWRAPGASGAVIRASEKAVLARTHEFASDSWLRSDRACPCGARCAARAFRLRCRVVARPAGRTRSQDRCRDRRPPGDRPRAVDSPPPRSSWRTRTPRCSAGWPTGT